MKIVNATFLITLLVSSPVSSQQKSIDERGNGPVDRRNVSGFGGRLVIVKDPAQFAKEWLKPEIPKIKRWSVTKVNRGDVLGAFVVFIGCKADALGVCRLRVDYTVSAPDNRIYAARKGETLSQQQTAPPPNLQLGMAIPAFQLERHDPPGEYRVKVKVSDLETNVSLELETKFWLN